MKVLVTGSSGYLGSRLCQVLADQWEIAGTHLTNLPNVPSGIDSVAVDLKDARTILDVVEQIRPDSIVHAAGLVGLQRCEAHPQEATMCNRDGAKHFAAAAAKIGAAMIYLSTDMVFDGSRGWYSDKETPKPICLYGLTKYDGEQVIREKCPKSCILRISQVYGWSRSGHRCFLESVIRDLRQGKSVSLFADEYRTPVLIDDLCETIRMVVEAELRGVFHIGGPKRMSRYDLGLQCARFLGLPEDRIIPVKQKDIDASRPSDCSLLVSDKIHDLGCRHRPPIEGLEYMAATERDFDHFKQPK